MKTIASLILIVGALSVGVAQDATATGTQTRSSAKPPCQDDVALFCKGVKPGNGAIMKCLQDNTDKLSVGCKSEIVQLSPCRAGQEKFCSGKHGKDLRNCVKSHHTEMADTCRVVANKSPAQQRQILLFCMADARKFCKQFKHPLDPGVNDCLISHKSELSAACKAAMPSK